MNVRIIRILAIAVFCLTGFYIGTIEAKGAVIRVIYAGGYDGEIEPGG